MKHLTTYVMEAMSVSDKLGNIVKKLQNRLFKTGHILHNTINISLGVNDCAPSMRWENMTGDLQDGLRELADLFNEYVLRSEYNLNARVYMSETKLGSKAHDTLDVKKNGDLYLNLEDLPDKDLMTIFNDLVDILKDWEKTHDWVSAENNQFNGKLEGHHGNGHIKKGYFVECYCDDYYFYPSVTLW